MSVAEGVGSGKLRQIAIRFDEAEFTAIGALATETNKSFAQMVRLLVKRGLAERAERARRRSSVADALGLTKSVRAGMVANAIRNEIVRQGVRCVYLPHRDMDTINGTLLDLRSIAAVCLDLAERFDD